MRKVRENILVASGNYPLFAADQDVFSGPGASGKGVTINVLPGQLVIYDPVDQKSLGPGIDVTTNDRIVVAVGVDTNGDGASDTLRKAFGEKVFGQYIYAANAEPPRCGVHEIVDVLYKCSEVGQEYTIQVNVEDDQTQNQYPYNRPSSYVFTVKTDEVACDDCDPQVFAGEIACKMVDAVKDKRFGTPATKISTFKKPVSTELPFSAHRLFSRSIVYCLNPVGDSCGTGCIAISGIKGVDIEETDGSGVVNTTFTNNLNPNDSTQTLQAQLDNIVDQINTALGDLGSAAVTRGITECCPIQLEINTCAFEFNLIDTSDADIDSCSEVNPLAAITVDNACRNCGDSASASITYDGGVRFISKGVDLECDCQFPPNPPKGYFGRKLDAYPSDGFATGGAFVRKTQPMQFPQNLGYQWQWKEYVSDNGGAGRGHNPFNYHAGPIGLPYANARALAGTVDCKTSYCSYTIEHGLPHTNTGVSDPFRMARGRTVVLIPSDDTTTRTEWEAVINSYIGSPSMPVKASMTCASDQDQDATFASGTLTMSGTAGDTETVTIGSVTYTFQTVLTDSANNVLIGANQTESMANLAAAITAGAGVGTTYGTGTVAHPDVTATSNAAVLTVTALEAGADGNDIATTETLTNGAFGAATLTGGADNAIAANPYPNANGYIL